VGGVFFCPPRGKNRVIIRAARGVPHHTEKYKKKQNKTQNDYSSTKYKALEKK
jgi:hypothetical protein